LIVKYRNSRQQRSLFELDQREIPFEESPAREAVAEDGPHQLSLFEGKVLLLGELERALLRCDFAAGIRVRQQLADQYGEAAVPSNISFLDKLGPEFWEDSRDLRERMAGRRALEADLPEGSPLHKAVKNCFWEKLLERHSPEEILLFDGCLLPCLFNVLHGLGRQREGRDLVRDRLLSGEVCNPIDFDDEVVNDILAEDLAPQWLASLGALHHVWARPRPSEREIAAFEKELTEPDPKHEEDRALAFWRCLSIAQRGRSLPETLLHDARRRMKRLNPDLHALYMGVNR
jgi:hypothetical protein